jgi:hypothetical protein
VPLQVAASGCRCFGVLPTFFLLFGVSAYVICLIVHSGWIRSTWPRTCLLKDDHVQPFWKLCDCFTWSDRGSSSSDVGQVTLQDRYIVHDGSIHGKQFLTHPNQLACWVGHCFYHRPDTGSLQVLFFFSNNKDFASCAQHGWSRGPEEICHLLGLMVSFLAKCINYYYYYYYLYCFLYNTLRLLFCYYCLYVYVWANEV